MRRLRFAVIGIAALLLGAYALSRSWAFLRGPRITLLTPETHAVAHQAAVMIAGKTDNVAVLTIAGREVFLQGNGEFREMLLFAPGSNIIEIRGRDKFGRSTTLRRNIIYAPE